MALKPCRECGKDVSTEAKTCPHCGVSGPVVASIMNKNFGCGTGCLALIALVVVVMVIGQLANSGADAPSSGSAGAPRPDPKRAVLSAVSVQGFTWEKGGFDNVMMVSLTIVNGSDRGVKDLRLECDYDAPSGTRLGTARKVVYESIPAGGRKALKEVNMGFIDTQASKAGCRVADLVLQ